MFAKKRKCADVATMLATLALERADHETAKIHKAAAETDLAGNEINNEYVIVKIWLLDKALNAAKGDSSAARELFWQKIRSYVADRGHLARFESTYSLRSKEYDVAWKDPSGIGRGVAMLNSFVAACGRDPDKYLMHLMPVYLTASAIYAETRDALRSFRVVT